MPLQLKKIKASKAKEVRVAYNKILKEDIKNDYFTEEQLNMLSDINKQHLIRILVEYKRVRYEMNQYTIHNGYHLVLNLEEEKGLYRFHFYEVDCNYHTIIPIISSYALLTKNEVEAFLYAHSKSFPNVFTKEGSSTSICYNKPYGNFEFLCKDTIQLNQIKEVYKLYTTYQRGRCYTLK